jgi:hypothetical protein
LTSPLLRPLDAAFNHAAAAPASNAQALRALLEMRVALDCLASPRKAANEESRP